MQECFILIGIIRQEIINSQQTYIKQLKQYSFAMYLLGRSFVGVCGVPGVLPQSKCTYMYCRLLSITKLSIVYG